MAIRFKNRTGCLAIGAVASMLGVGKRTLRRWDKASMFFVACMLRAHYNKNKLDRGTMVF